MNKREKSTSESSFITVLTYTDYAIIAEILPGMRESWNNEMVKGPPPEPIPYWIKDGTVGGKRQISCE